MSILQEFFEFAQGWDKNEGRSPLEMTYAIEGDLVGGISIKYQLCKDSKWTQALKYMLANLKWALAWLVARQSGQVLVKSQSSARPSMCWKFLLSPCKYCEFATS